VLVTTPPPSVAVSASHVAPMAHPPVVAVGVAVRVAVAVAVARVLAVAVRVAVAVAVAPVLQVPLFVHQLSLLGLKGELGGQSLVAGIGATAVYFDPLNVTTEPLAYAVQLANAGTPAQLT
jgi:hypothetical protein